MIRIYLSPQVGIGSMIDPWRSRINLYIQLGEYFDEWNNHDRHISICFVDAIQASHDAIAADSLITPLSRMHSSDADLESGLDTPLSQFTDPELNNLKAALENAGIDTGWTTPATTLRTLIRVALRNIYLNQTSDGREPLFIEFLTTNSDATFGSLRLIVRNRIRNWFQNHGLDDSWITQQTTLREIRRYIINNMSFPRIRIFRGIEF